VFVLLMGLVGLVFTRMPNSFLPNEDQGYIIANIQLPPGATAERTNAVLKARRSLRPEAAGSGRHGP
jgi:multidrug efflux pump